MFTNLITVVFSQNINVSKHQIVHFMSTIQQSFFKDRRVIAEIN